MKYENLVDHEGLDPEGPHVYACSVDPHAACSARFLLYVLGPAGSLVSVGAQSINVLFIDIQKASKLGGKKKKHN